MRQRSIIPLGDRALTADLSDVGGAPTRDVIRALVARAQTDAPPGVTGVVPAIRTLTLHYDPARTSFDALAEYIDACIATLVISDEIARDPVVIPVCYGGRFGPDLDDVAAAHDSTADAIVAAHVAGTYTVAMIGFLPGFPYLDGLAESLHTPRRSTPRTHVPAGSIGIGGSSTGVYPFTSPGGWHLVGRTPRLMF
ncbi:MAG TPA: 5-oxoprolinase subunit PxpB, partial [Gemmatimonadaceae bacterium]|nr:5-oxoprolinase subunit PxpB [Gemmatimonadaceae bacterium]